MKYCVNCRTDFFDTYTKCPRCGSRLAYDFETRIPTKEIMYKVETLPKWIPILTALHLVLDCCVIAALLVRRADQ